MSWHFGGVFDAFSCTSRVKECKYQVQPETDLRNAMDINVNAMITSLLRGQHANVQEIINPAIYK